MSTRSRRANAGNRLSMLLAEQTPLNDEESELFAERDDDEDFDLEAEEERQRQLAAASASSDDEQGSQRGGSNAEVDDDENDDDDDDDDDESGSEHDDENFSDTTDDSEIENDVEPADAGEKELAKEQRMQAREKRIAERNKMFTIKRRVPKPEAAPGAEQRKKRVFTSADVLLEGRHSSRKSALRNKQHLIEQMREVEERRARYVPPQRKKQPKLTQEQRLEEAKKTEARNLASLNKFVELEEERKLQQRLAMISRRPKLTQFVRFHSTQYLAEPKLIQIVPEKTEEDGAQVKTEFSITFDGAATSDAQPQPQPQPSQTSPQKGELNESEPQKAQFQKVEPGSEAQEPEAVNSNGSAEHNEAGAEAKATEKSEQIEQSKRDPDQGGLQQLETGKEPGSEPGSEPGNEPQDIKQEEENGSAVPVKQEAHTEATTLSADSKEDANEVRARGINDAEMSVVKAEPGDPDFENVKQEEEDEEKLDKVQGPAQLKTYDFLTLHEFSDVSLNKYAARNIILGRIASKPAHMPLKRMCPFSGLPARYLDPSTGVAYYGLESNKLLKLAADNKLAWSKELGGVFLGTGGEQRHAKGVPEGFA